MSLVMILFSNASEMSPTVVQYAETVSFRKSGEVLYGECDTR